MPHDILALPAFNDNYIWMIIHRESNQAVVVDPGDAHVVSETLSTFDFKLHGILITHHHWDHVNGVEELVKQYSVPVYGPNNPKLAYIDHILYDEDVITLEPLQLRFQVMTVPGHTLDHIAYFGQEWLFCGDTLFSGGCGRLFEGTPAQLYQSLQRMAKLPPETRVYCAHEYTLRNLEFAQLIEPNNQQLLERLQKVRHLRERGLPTIPSTITTENEINPFLRCNQPIVVAAAEKFCETRLGDQIAVFAALRRWKDTF